MKQYNLVKPALSVITAGKYTRLADMCIEAEAEISLRLEHSRLLALANRDEESFAQYCTAMEMKSQLVEACALVHNY